MPLKKLSHYLHFLLETLILIMKSFATVITLGWDPFLLDFLHWIWTFISSIWSFIFIISVSLLLFHFFLLFLIWIITSLKYKSMTTFYIFFKVMGVCMKTWGCQWGQYPKICTHHFVLRSLVLIKVFSFGDLNLSHLNKIVFLFCKWINECTQRRNFPIGNNKHSSMKRIHKNRVFSTQFW